MAKPSTTAAKAETAADKEGAGTPPEHPQQPEQQKQWMSKRHFQETPKLRTAYDAPKG